VKGESCYNLVRVDNPEFNYGICDRILGESRASRFLVAGVIGQRQGGYFKAGFAEGLDLSVIWTCRGDGINRVNLDVK
jgi:hypothetical protein